LRERQLDLESIVTETLPYYPHFRKVDGKPYTANSARRSIISALSANGVFAAHGTPDDRVYSVHEESAQKWRDEQTSKFNLKRQELAKKPRKYKMEIIDQ
jgi:hypothetical protein